MLTRLWNDTDGGIVSTELVLVGSLVVMGVLGGMTKLSHSISKELSDLGTDVSTAADQTESLHRPLASPNDEVHGIEMFSPQIKR